MRQGLRPGRRQQDVGQAYQKEGQQRRTPHEPHIVIDGRPRQGADQRRAGRHGRAAVPHIDAQGTGRAERGPQQQAQQAAQQEDPQMKMGRIHPRQTMMDDVRDGPGRTPDRRQQTDEDEDFQDVADGPHAPAAQADDLAGPKAQPESMPGKTQQAEGQSPQQGCARDDAQGQSPQKQRYDDGVHGHDSIPLSPGPVKRFSAGKASAASLLSSPGHAGTVCPQRRYSFSNA